MGEQSGGSERRHEWWEWLLVAGAFAIVLGVWSCQYLKTRAAPLYTSSSEYDLGKRGQFGDSFGAVNALFTGLAFAAVAVGLWYQGKELRHTQEELGLTKKAFEQAKMEHRAALGASTSQLEFLTKINSPVLNLTARAWENSGEGSAEIRVANAGAGAIILDVGQDGWDRPRWTEDPRRPVLLQKEGSYTYGGAVRHGRDTVVFRLTVRTGLEVDQEYAWRIRLQGASRAEFTTQGVERLEEH